MNATTAQDATKYIPAAGDFATIRYGNGTQLVYVVKVTKTGSAKVLRCFGRGTKHTPKGTWKASTGSVKAEEFLGPVFAGNISDSETQAVRLLACEVQVAKSLAPHAKPGTALRATVEDQAERGNPVALRILEDLAAK